MKSAHTCATLCGRPPSIDIQIKFTSMFDSDCTLAHRVFDSGIGGHNGSEGPTDALRGKASSISRHRASALRHQERQVRDPLLPADHEPSEGAGHQASGRGLQHATSVSLEALRRPTLGCPWSASSSGGRSRVRAERERAHRRHRYRSTVSGGSYEREILRISPRPESFPGPAPLFVPLPRRVGATATSPN
jgi:hypothetical protein